jgi:hypothetical protein
MAANGISTLTIPTGITATSFTGSYPVSTGTFNYDSYGAGFSVRKDSGTIDTYINQVLALPTPPARQYTGLTFTYGEAQISFTLNANGTFTNVTCPYGAGGYPYGGAVDPAITMPGNQFVGGTTPANDIVWEYTVDVPGGAITGFTYRSGTPPIGRIWTFVPANGQPSFTRAMQAPTTNVELPAETVPTWNIATAGGVNLGGNTTNYLNPTTTPVGTEFNIYVTELGGGGGADKEARQIAKLNIAQAKRQGKTVADDGTITGSVDDTKPYYRARNNYDITQLPTQYDGYNVVDNPNDTFTLTPGAIRTGVKKVTYTGYHDEDVAFTDTATVTDTTTATNFTIASIAENTTVLYTGYLLATYTGTWTFTLTSDDSSYLWIGSTAVSGYTTSNELTTASYLGAGSGTISLTAGQYYPIRLLYGNGPAGGNLNLTYAHTGQTATNNFAGKLFSPGVRLVVGRPWTYAPFTFYETTGTTATISTTQYVIGNKIYAESSTYDVPSYQPARVVVNDIEVVDTELRGHTLVVLDSNGDVATTATQYDTWDTGGAPGARAALASALGSVASGNIAVLVVYDASGLDAGIRSAINTGYGSTNTDTWVSGRRSHIFIGIKI